MEEVSDWRYSGDTPVLVIDGYFHMLHPAIELTVAAVCAFPFKTPAPVLWRYVTRLLRKFDFILLNMTC